jgi:lipopolysaccharide transport system ATP-binding protein
VSDVAITVENLGKEYRIGTRERHDTLRDALAGTFKRSNVQTFKRYNSFWALKDVSFEVRRGEVVGVIGRNGAGKSTLLKILSRITEPTTGRAVIHGRVGSLLEVGTGFHPELTGRENIYLNGAILGMRRAEIDRRFDEIVAFSEIERFLDTPVKRYSSGMYVRLAFAVAAHLDPEVLIVDEVLAVGDAAFQKKCLGKMGDVAGEGRTVIFVSHNMAAVESLCPRCMLLEEGSIVCDDSSAATIRRYSLSSGIKPGSERAGHFALSSSDDASSSAVVIGSMKLMNERGETTSVFRTGQTLRLEIEVSGLTSYYDTECAAVFCTDAGQRVFTITSWMACHNLESTRTQQETALLTVTDLPLTPGRYWIDLYVYGRSEGYIEYLSRAGWIDVIEGNVYGNGYRVQPSFGLVYAHGTWDIRNRTLIE